MKVEGMPPQAMNAAANNGRIKEVSGKEFPEQVKADKTEVAEAPYKNFGQEISAMAKLKIKEGNFGAEISVMAKTRNQISEQSEEDSVPEPEDIVAETKPGTEESSSIEAEIPEAVADVTPTTVVDTLEELLETPGSQNESQAS